MPRSGDVWRTTSAGAAGRTPIADHQRPPSLLRHGLDPCLGMKCSNGHVQLIHHEKGFGPEQLLIVPRPSQVLSLSLFSYLFLKLNSFCAAKSSASSRTSSTARLRRHRSQVLSPSKATICQVTSPGSGDFSSMAPFLWLGLNAVGPLELRR